jgi:hypothetical protein
VHEVVLIIPDVCVGQVIDNILESLAELLAILDEEFGLFVVEVVEVGQDPSASGLVGVDLPQLSQLGVRLLVVSSELFQTALVLAMETTSNDIVIVDGKDVAAPLVIVPLQETKPGPHPVPTFLVFTQDSTSGPFSADLFDASKEGRVLLLEGLPINQNPRKIM